MRETREARTPRFSLAPKTPIPFSFKRLPRRLRRSLRTVDAFQATTGNASAVRRLAKARLISNAVIEQAIYKFPSRFC